METKSAILLPFMGPLPAYFDCWAKSCETNHRHFHWFVYSDQTDARRAVNAAVTLIPYRYERMIADFKRYLDIAISDASPRMLCTYRLLFYFLRRDREPLDDYQFIGYTDMDVIYGELSAHMPDHAQDYTLISADQGHPCGPFTLMRIDRVRTLSAVEAVRREMTMKTNRAYDESASFLETVANGGPFWCRPGSLQPAMVAPINHRHAFSVWENGKVTVGDRWGRRQEGGFHHFSRYKDRNRFTVAADPRRDEKWAVCKRGIIPVRSPWTWLRLRLSLI